MKLREMHLINNGEDLVYTSITENAEKAIISVESQHKDIFLIYHQPIQGAVQIDSFQVIQLEDILKQNNYTQSFDRDAIVAWSN